MLAVVAWIFYEAIDRLRTPVEVKRYLLSKPSHRTSLGTIRFNRTGDSQGGLQAYWLSSPEPSPSP